MRKTLAKVTKEAEIEATWWKWAAWTAPFVALALLVFEHWIGREDWWSTTIFVISVVFFTAGVLWWWWALAKIIRILKTYNETNEKFDAVLNELKTIKDEVKKGL